MQKELELSGLVIANYLGVVELLGRMSRGRHQPHRVGAPGPCHTDSFRPAHARTRARARPRPRPRPRPHQPCHPLYLPERLGGQRRDLPEHATQRRPLGILLINRRYLPPARCPPLRHPPPPHTPLPPAAVAGAGAARAPPPLPPRALNPPPLHPTRQRRRPRKTFLTEIPREGLPPGLALAPRDSGEIPRPLMKSRAFKTSAPPS